MRLRVEAGGGCTRGKGLLELVCLVVVLHAQGVQEPGAPDLELGLVAILFDAHRLGVRPPRGQQELLDLRDLTRLRGTHSTPSA